MVKKRQLLTLLLTSKIKDCFGVYEVEALISGKPYTYLISSAFAVEECERLIRLRKPGKAINWLKKFNLKEE